MNLGDEKVLVVGEVPELAQRFVGEFVLRATLFIDPHRV